MGLQYKLNRSLSREREPLRAEMAATVGLMPLLMERRNYHKWTDHERTELHDALRRFSTISRYGMVFLWPGSSLLLPLLAWWLDRRREERLTITHSE